MKYQTTKKQIMNNYDRVIKVPYCALQTLLKDRTPIAYTCSKTYGWRADVYEITDGMVIVTGYAPFGNIEPSHDLLMKYELEAEKAIEQVWKNRIDYYQACEDEHEKLWWLLRDFITELMCPKTE